MSIVLKKIKVDNFRLFKDKEFIFKSGVNLIVGKNATGKTSVLEAINLLGVCKSFRTHADYEMLKEKEQYFCVEGVICKDLKDIKVIVSFSNVGKKINVNGKVIKKQSDYIGTLNVICFSPADMNIIKGESRFKRSFLDQNISFINKLYLKSLIDYNKILKERNELLKNYQNFNNNSELLKIYTNQLIENAKEIVKTRKEFVEKLSDIVSSNLKKLTNEKENLEIRYKPSLEFENLKEIGKYLSKDIETQTTCYGPHKDSFEIIVNGKEVSKYCSQGQQKSVAISLKIAVTDLLEVQGKECIIILDDVFGELDNKRQEFLMMNLKDKGQIFISTTDVSALSSEVLSESNIIKMDEGE